MTQKHKKLVSHLFRILDKNKLGWIQAWDRRDTVSFVAIRKECNSCIRKLHDHQTLSAIVWAVSDFPVCSWNPKSSLTEWLTENYLEQSETSLVDLFQQANPFRCSPWHNQKGLTQHRLILDLHTCWGDWVLCQCALFWIDTLQPEQNHCKNVVLVSPKSDTWDSWANAAFRFIS